MFDNDSVYVNGSTIDDDGRRQIKKNQDGKKKHAVDWSTQQQPREQEKEQERWRLPTGG
jgi:hypothetical protein